MEVEPRGEEEGEKKETQKRWDISIQAHFYLTPKRHNLFCTIFSTGGYCIEKLNGLL